MPVFTKEEKIVIATLKATNIVNVAINMNPTNYPELVNKAIKDGYFHKGGICHGIIMKTVPGDPDLFCASGIGTCFGIVNGDFDKLGGFPKDPSSQLMVNEKNKHLFPKQFVFKPGEHYELGTNTHQGYLTQKGINLFTEVGKLKGALYSVWKANGKGGHIGIIMGTDWQKVGPPGEKWRAFMHTIEFNTKNGTSNKDLAFLQNKNEYYIQQLRTDPVNYYDVAQKKLNPNYQPKEVAGDERNGGKLAFRTRLIGGLWFGDTEVTNVTICPIDQFYGGSYAPNGLSSRDTLYDFFGQDPMNNYNGRLWTPWGRIKDVIYEP
jgi:hypothetical protein